MTVMSAMQSTESASGPAPRQGRWRETPSTLATGVGLLSALLATSCCILPLLFVFIGVSGAWIGTLTALAPYQPFFLAAAVLALALGFRSARRYALAACSDGYCASTRAIVLRRVALWTGAVLVAFSVAFNLVVPLLIA